MNLTHQGRLFAVGGGAGFAGNLTKQTVDIGNGTQTTFSGKELAVSTAAGVVLGGAAEKLLPNAKISRLSSGQGNMKTVAQGVKTRIENGTAANMSVKTAAKGAVGSQAQVVIKTAGGGAGASQRLRPVQHHRGKSVALNRYLVRFRAISSSEGRHDACFCNPSVSELGRVPAGGNYSEKS